MAGSNNDIYTRIKWNLFQIFPLILLLFAMIKIVVVEAPHNLLPSTPFTERRLQQNRDSCACTEGKSRSKRNCLQRRRQGSSRR